MASDPRLKDRLAADIERCWDWFEHWGQPSNEVDLAGLDTIALLDLRDEVQTRVRVLAENWATWW